MTLEEAIIHCKEKACDNTQCALEHRQLAEWLEELQQYRNKGNSMTDKEKIAKLKSLGWKMYDAYQYLTNDTSRIREAMEEWWHFVNIELNKEEQCMKKEDAIKYLQQLYPNGGNCWLDEQRIEAIGMAIKALQEEPVSEEKLSNVQITVKNLNEDFENALAEEWKGYNDRGAAKVDALEDNTQELAFAKGFYRGWHYMDDDGLRKAVEGVSEELSNYINELSKQFQEVSFAKLSRIAVRVAKWQKEKDAILPKVWNRENLDDFSYQTAYDLSNDWAKETPTWHDVEMACKLGAKWQKEKDSIISEDLEEAADSYIKTYGEILGFGRQTFKAGAKWQKKQFEKDCTDLCNGIATAKGIAVAMAYDNGMADAREQMMKNIWKPADGDDLPEIDREVVAFQEIFPTDVDVPSLLKIVIAHRPNTEGYDGKSITTGQVEHYTPKTYDKGGWNIPNVKWWLDCSMPKVEED